MDTIRLVDLKGSLVLVILDNILDETEHSGDFLKNIQFAGIGPVGISPVGISPVGIGQVDIGPVDIGLVDIALAEFLLLGKIVALSKLILSI